MAHTAEMPTAVSRRVTSETLAQLIQVFPLPNRRRRCHADTQEMRCAGERLNSSATRFACLTEQQNASEGRDSASSCHFMIIALSRSGISNVRSKSRTL
jgi:hypothetical protein